MKNIIRQKILHQKLVSSGKEAGSNFKILEPVTGVGDKVASC